MIKADFLHFVFKTDYFPYFVITNTLGYLAILFRRYESCFQVASNSPPNHCFNQNKKKQNRGCFTKTVYVEAWCDMQIHEALWKVLYVMKCSLEVPSVMLGRSNFSVNFWYTGRVRNFGYLLQFV